LFDWIFIIYFNFKLKMLAYTCINHSGDGADQKLPKTIVVTCETVREYFCTVREVKNETE